MVGIHRFYLVLLGVAVLTQMAAAQTPLYPQSPPTRNGMITTPTNPNQPGARNMTTGQTPYNTATLGQRQSQLPPGAAGYNPYVNPVNPAPTIVVNTPPPSYTSGSPYSVSTAPSYGGYSPGFFPGYVGNLGLAGPGIGAGAAMQGAAALQSSTGQYWNSIEQARITREQSRQAHIDTERKQVEWERDYERMKPTAITMRDAQRATDLNWARNDPPRTEIWSGQTLNVLLRSIRDSDAPTRGPNIYLDPETLRGLNLTDMTTRGSLAMAKDNGKIEWTDALMEKPFDEVRNRFSKNFDKAISLASSSEPPDRALIGDLRSDLKTINDKLDDRVTDLPASQYIEARRVLNKLSDAIKGLSNSRVVRSCNCSWKKTVHTVADLVAYCMKNGLQFGPAVASGDSPCYTAAYYAIRSYERGVAGDRRASTSN
jgi:hypothetical protein